jgi:hypothetical protein
VTGTLTLSCGAKLSFTKPKTHVPGFSPKYFTIWGTNMDTKHTAGEQIFVDLLENQGKKRSEMSPLERSWRCGRTF